MYVPYTLLYVLDLNLGGRIRVSHEGINGVLSGTQESLHEACQYS